MNLLEFIQSQGNLQKLYDKCLYTLKKYHLKPNVYPPISNAFDALLKVQVLDLKVVIVGQDPYHQKGQANGLAFSVNKGVKLPKSLVNIYKEIEDNFNKKMFNDGDLTYLANQGVLLWNVFLSVEDSKPLSHTNENYSQFSEELLKFIDLNFQDTVFLLWGKKAQEYEKILKNSHVLKSSHPSPLSSYRGFFGCMHFKKTNQILKSLKKEEIDWIN